MSLIGFATPYATGFGTHYLPGAHLGPVGPVPPPYVPTIFEEALEAYLLAALEAPAWPGILPAAITQAMLPGLVWNLISADQEEDLLGPTDIGHWTVQFDAYGKTLLDASTLIERLKSILHGYSGPMGSVEVLNCLRADQSTGYERLPTATSLVTQRRMASYEIWFREPIPTF